MLGQTVAPLDVLRLFILSFLEVVLSIDNGLALTLIVRHLPTHLRKKALFYGVSSAFILRAFAILLAAYLIKFVVIQILGSLYLLYFMISFFLYKQKERPQKNISLWKAIVLVELTDCIFAIDSILAGLALIGVHFDPSFPPPKIWIIYFGGIMGMISIRFAAQPFARLIDRFPGFEMGAHLMMGWIGLKLLLTVYFKANHMTVIGLEHFFWAGIFAFVFISFFLKGRAHCNK